jgi:hypothetical protein
MAALAASWRRQGVRVTGIEIDHDCATAGLPAYLDWLEQARAGLRESGTVRNRGAEVERA